MGKRLKMLKTAHAKGVGRSHISSGSPCQDYVTVSSCKFKSTAIALSDGAGSCELSHIGAELITTTTSSLLAKHFNSFYCMNDSELAILIIDKIQLILHIRALADGKENIKPYSGTLLAVAVSRGRFIAMHIGDGVIGHITNDTASVLSVPENGEYSNTTFFASEKDAVSHLRIYKGSVQKGDSFILMSDGTEESLYDKNNKSLAPGCIIMAKWLGLYSEAKVTKILEQNITEVFTKKSSDDCSIALLRV